MTRTVILERKGGTAVLRLNRPDAYNALNLEILQGFAEAMVELATDNSTRGVVLTGEGKAFCAGGDLKWVDSFPEGKVAAFHRLASNLHVGVTEMRRMSKPVVAAINGVAAGAGLTLALACDFRVMDPDATMRQAYTSSGLCIDGGGTFTLPRLVGLARAMEIAAFDKTISSERALEWGMVTKVSASGRSLDEALSMAGEIAAGSLHSFGLAKQLFNDSFETSLETQLERERAGLCKCGGHPDGIEGIGAFIEKRKPSFGAGT